MTDKENVDIPSSNSSKSSDQTPATPVRMKRSQDPDNSGGTSGADNLIGVTLDAKNLIDDTATNKSSLLYTDQNSGARSRPSGNHFSKDMFALKEFDLKQYHNVTVLEEGGCIVCSDSIYSDCAYVPSNEICLGPVGIPTVHDDQQYNDATLKNYPIYYYDGISEEVRATTERRAPFRHGARDENSVALNHTCSQMIYDNFDDKYKYFVRETKYLDFRDLHGISINYDWHKDDEPEWHRHWHGRNEETPGRHACEIDMEGAEGLNMKYSHYHHDNYT